MKDYSGDLRKKVPIAYQDGKGSVRQPAERFAVFLRRCLKSSIGILLTYSDNNVKLSNLSGLNPFTNSCDDSLHISLCLF